ncbi:MAG TPA: hypothetical protein VFQ23_09920, partial [Anaerolineales bacterium]|nr:hypothetical protein [Anaerolineales bacterium]
MRFSQRFWRGLVFLLFIAALCGGMVLPAASIGAAPLMQATACVGTTITQWTFAGDVVTPSTGSGTYLVGPGLPATTFAAG